MAEVSLASVHEIPGTRPRHVVDAAEKFLLIALLGLLAYRLVPHLAHKPINIVFLAVETMVVLCIAFRRPASAVSVKPFDWLTSFGGTFLPLLVTGSDRSGFAPAGSLMVAGFFITVAAQLSLRRSIGVVAANRGVVTAGVYRIVRHPMYLGYFLTQAGFLLTNPSAWNAAVWMAWTVCQLTRIRAEERVLSADAKYLAFRERVRYRLLPLIY